MTRSLSPEITIEDLRIDNMPDGHQENFVSANHIQLKFKLLPLLNKTIHINSLDTENLVVALEKSVSGNKNWASSSLVADEAKNPDSRLDIKITRLNSLNTDITYTDQNNSNSQTVHLKKLLGMLDLKASIVSLDTSGSINTFPFTVYAGMEEPLSEVDPNPISMIATFAGTKMEVLGSVDLNDGHRPLTANLIFQADSTRQITQPLQLAIPELGSINLAASLDANLSNSNETEKLFSALNVKDMILDINGKTLDLTVSGAVSDIPHTNNINIDVHGTTDELAALLSDFGSPKTLLGNASLKANVVGTPDDITVKVQSASVNTDNLTFNASGLVQDALGDTRTDLDIFVETPNLDIVTDLFNVAMPPEWGPIKANASLNGNRDRFYLHNIDATLDSNSKATAKGYINSLYPFDDMRLETTAKLHTLAEISAFTPKPLPDIGPMLGTGVVTWSQGALQLIGGDAKYKGPYGIAAVTGNIGDLIQFDKVRLRADIDAPDFKALDLFTGFALPDVDRVVASANIISDIPRDMSAKNLNIIAERDGVKLSATGDVRSIIKEGARVDLELSANINSLTELDQLLGQTMPALGPAQASAKLTGVKDKIALSDVIVDLNDDALVAQLTSQPGLVKHIESVKADVSLNTKSIKNALEKLGVASTLSVPATLVSELTFAGKDIEIQNTRIDLSGNRANVDITLKNALSKDDRNLIQGAINIEALDLVTLLEKPVGLTANDADGRSTVFSTLPIPFRQLTEWDTDIVVQIDKLTSRVFDIQQSYVNLRTTNGLITMGPFVGQVNGGQGSILLTADTRKRPTEVKLELELDDFDLGRAGLVSELNLVENSGGTYASLSLNGKGENLSDIMATSHGEGGLYVTNLRIDNNILDILSSDVLTQLVEAINPFKKKRKSTHFICTSTRFTLEDGKLHMPVGYAMEAEEFAIVGKGSVDFRTETLDLEFSSKPKKGFGLSFSRITSLVELEGPMSKPELSFSETGALKFTASLAAAIASGGASFLAESLIQRAHARSGVCATAVGG